MVGDVAFEWEGGVPHAERLAVCVELRGRGRGRGRRVDLQGFETDRARYAEWERECCFAFAWERPTLRVSRATNGLVDAEGRDSQRRCEAGGTAYNGDDGATREGRPTIPWFQWVPTALVTAGRRAFATAAICWAPTGERTGPHCAAGRSEARPW